MDRGWALAAAAAPASSCFLLSLRLMARDAAGDEVCQHRRSALRGWDDMVSVEIARVRSADVAAVGAGPVIALEALLLKVSRDRSALAIAVPHAQAGVVD